MSIVDGPLEIKREILSTLGSNLLLKDKKLLIDIDKSLLPLKKAAPVIERIKKRFEPLNTPEKQGQFGQECLKSPIVLREHHVTIPLFFNREFMQQMAQRLALIKLMQQMEEQESLHAS